MFILIMWTAIVGYFTDSSKITCLYGINTLLMLKESLDNQKVLCMKYLLNIKVDINSIFETRLLFIFIVRGQVFKNDKYEQFRGVGLINIIRLNNSYFLVSFICGVHMAIVLGTTAISPYLSPITFHLLNKKTGL